MKYSVFTVCMPEYTPEEAVGRLKRWGYDGVEWRFFTRPDQPVTGGGFWAGINLCMVNLLLRISQEESKAVFLSIYNIAGGVGEVAGPMLAGLVLTSIAHLDFHFFTWKVYPLQVIFLTSSLFRLLSFQIFKLVKEPEESTAKEIIRILRSLRGMNITNGFNYLLHPFAVVEKEDRD